jgi:hypothetical protein
MNTGAGANAVQPSTPNPAGGAAPTSAAHASPSAQAVATSSLPDGPNAGSNSGVSAPLGTAPPVGGTTFAPAAISNAPPLSEDERIEKLVITYLKRRGFANTAEALASEAAKAKSGDKPGPLAPLPDIHSYAAEMSLDQHTHLYKQIVHFSLAESNPDVYTSSFEKLRRWMVECMDVYKNELQLVLWPLVAHVFIQLIHRGFPHDAHRFLARHRGEHEVLHRAELQVFQNLITDSDLQKCEIIRWFLQRKVEVALSSFSHQLLLSFLHENNFVLLLKIVNEHLHIKITARKPLAIQGESSASVSIAGNFPVGSSGFNALNPVAILNLNNVPIRWGVLPEIAEIHSEAAAKLKTKLIEDNQMKKLLKLQAEKQERERVESEKKAAPPAASGAKESKEDDEEGESARKKAKLEDGGAGGSAADANSKPAAPAAAPGADTEMADIGGGEEKEGADGAAGEAATDPSKKKKAKRREDAAGSAGAGKDTKEERDFIEKEVRRRVKQPEPMVQPKKEEQIVKLPPM